ncbi:MAG: hypothetical protein RL748_69 [Pseudomonadota bacterium]|jgi:hypothetical protein
MKSLVLLAISSAIAAPSFAAWEFKNITSNTGVAGAEVFVGQVSPTGSAQTATLNVTKTLTVSKTVTTTGGVNVDAAVEFTKVKVGGGGSFSRASANTYTTAYTGALTSAVSLKAGQGVKFYGYLTGRYYSYDTRGCNFGLCTSWVRQTIFVAQGTGVRPQVY